jgi:hypothetical protein
MGVLRAVISVEGRGGPCLCSATEDETKSG